MIKKQKWIKADFAKDYETCPVFRKIFNADNVKRATLDITAKGIYYAELNGKRIGDYIFAPGCTVFSERTLYQTYDITDLVKNGENVLDVTVSAGWYHGRIVRQHNTESREKEWDAEIIALIRIEYINGAFEHIGTDSSWLAGKGPVLFSDLYDGEIFDANVLPHSFVASIEDRTASTEMLVPTDGEKICEHEVLSPIEIITTPAGDTVIDFGQNITGYPEITVNAAAGEKISLSFAEILDKDGNFYNENYRSAKCNYIYTCKDGLQTYKPRLSFYGFRYVRINELSESVKLSSGFIKAIAVYSDIKRTGYLMSSDTTLNQLFSNIFWGQKCNYLDIPTDCPQRDERLGWTGDAQVFAKTASYNFDVEKFFTKWLRDMRAQNKKSGKVGFIIPSFFDYDRLAAAWSDAAVIVPWQIYETYGNKELLKENLGLMESHVKNIIAESPEEYTWRNGGHTHQFGDWLGMDANPGSYTGSTRPDLIQAAYFAYDVSLLVKAYEVLGLNSDEYKELYTKIKERFVNDFAEYKTQTECVLALYFDLAADKAKTAAQLADMVVANGNKLTTGFVGTPYLLHALSENGYTELAYTLLLQEGYPSWLYSVNMGATTMWEHWDGINDKGEVWSKDMNSFNHYAYGAVADWVYEVAAGIKCKKAGFEKIVVEPHPDKRLGMLEASIETRNGKVSSKWYYKNGKARYEITVPVKSEIIIDGIKRTVEKGTYIF